MKTMRNKTRAGKQGAALVTMMIVLLLVCMASAALVAFATQQTHAAGRVRDYMKAQAYAEAGINHAYNAIKTNFDLAADPAQFPALDFGDGHYDVTVTVVGDTQASLVSVGECGDATITVKADVKNLAPATPGSDGSELPPSNPWGYSVLVNGYIMHNGAGTACGDVHVNNYLRCNGSLTWGATTNLCAVSAVSANDGFRANGDVTVLGSVRAPTITVNGQDNIQTKIVGPVDVVSFPTLDLTPYYQIALANGQVYGSQSPNGTVDWGVIPGGVRWINGNLTQNGSLTFEGCVIATGNVRFNGAVTQTRVGQLPAIISRDSYVRMNGHHVIRGLVYAKGDVTWNGAGSIHGAILVGGNMTFNGAYGNIYYSLCEPSPDATEGSEGTAADHVVITAWQK